MTQAAGTVWERSQYVASDYEFYDIKCPMECISLEVNVVRGVPPTFPRI